LPLLAAPLVGWAGWLELSPQPISKKLAVRERQNDIFMPAV
jgi:hypothetical protein